MVQRYPYILLFGIMLFSTFRVAGQMTMSDNVCIGQTRQYYVDPDPGSTYTWWIDGVVQAGFNSSEFLHTWNAADTFLLEVQERSADGCLGPVRSGQVYVKPTHDMHLIIPNAFSPNGDLINDVWNIGNTDLYPGIEIIIYNRWGQVVWKSEKGYPRPWDGRGNGYDLPIDSYHYTISFHNGSKPIIGHITIVR